MLMQLKKGSSRHKR